MKRESGEITLLDSRFMHHVKELCRNNLSVS